MPDIVIRQVPRSKLLEIFKTEELVRVFESLLQQVGAGLPSDTAAVQAALTAHINDPADAHPATAITNTPAGTIAATNVQAAINELSGDITALANAFATLGTLSTQNANAIAVTGGTVLLATGSLGYASGNGGTVTQATSKTTGVTLNKPSGEITMNAASLAAGASVVFTLTDSAIAAGDRVIPNHMSGGTFGAYNLDARAAAGSADFVVRNLTAGALAEAIVIGFTVVKSATA